MFIVLAASRLPALSNSDTKEIEGVINKIKKMHYAAEEPELIRLGKRAGPLIESLTEDRNPEVRLRAVECLQVIDYNVVPNIIKQLGERGTMEFDRYFQMLHSHKNSEAKDFLLQLFENKNTKPAIRSDAMVALSWYSGDKKVVRAFIDAYQNNAAPKMEIVRALGALGRDEAFDQLADALKSERADLRVAAVVSLGLIGGDKCAKAVSEMLGDKDARVRGAAVRMLGFMRAQNYIQEMESIAKNDADPENRWVAGSAAEKIKKEAGIAKNSQAEAINLFELLRIEPGINKAEYAMFLKMLKALKRDNWSLLIRKIDDVFSTFVIEEPDDEESAGFLFIAMYRPLREIDETAVNKALSAIVPDKTYDLRLRHMALEASVPSREVLKKIADDPTDHPEFRVTVKNALESNPEGIGDADD